MSPSRKIIIPLDVSTRDDALTIVERLRGRVGMFKVGLQLFCSEGPDLVRRIVDLGEDVFLDLKLHDIPNTVARAAAEAARLGVAMLDVHLAGGARMIRAAVETLGSCAPAGRERPRLLGVTVLTSFSGEDLASIGVPANIEEQVVTLARLGRDAGLDGVVASPLEITAIRKSCGREFLVVTPGIRPAGSVAGDQRRVTTPAEAVLRGADFLVIGRPILEAPDPVAAVEAITREMEA